MARIDRLKKINYQYLKPKLNTIAATWDEVDYVEAAQSTLNAQVVDDTTTIADDEMPETFLETTLDWAAGTDNDTIVKIRKNDIYVVQDLTQENLNEHEFTTTPNIGLGYFGRSYYGGAL